MWYSTVGFIGTLALGICLAPRASDGQAPTKVHRIGAVSCPEARAAPSTGEADVGGTEDARRP